MVDCCLWCLVDYCGFSCWLDLFVLFRLGFGEFLFWRFDLFCMVVGWLIDGCCIFAFGLTLYFVVGLCL